MNEPEPDVENGAQACDCGDPACEAAVVARLLRARQVSVREAMRIVLAARLADSPLRCVR